MTHSRSPISQKGFTIIELMIATVVLSTILLLVTIVMISIGNLYYKGVNQARVQDDTRSISDDISQHLQLSEGATAVSNGTTKAYCMGSARYTYVLYQQISSTPGTGQSQHVLWRDTNPTPGSCSITGPYAVDLSQPTPSSGGTELIAPNSRLTSFCISGKTANSCIPDDTTYTIDVGVAYGDSDLICDSGYTGPPADCSFRTGESQHVIDVIAGSQPLQGQILCKSTTGDQFCATSALHTNAGQRLTGS